MTTSPSQKKGVLLVGITIAMNFPMIIHWSWTRTNKRSRRRSGDSTPMLSSILAASISSSTCYFSWSQVSDLTFLSLPWGYPSNIFIRNSTWNKHWKLESGSGAYIGSVLVENLPSVFHPFNHGCGGMSALKSRELHTFGWSILGFCDPLHDGGCGDVHHVRVLRGALSSLGNSNCHHRWSCFLSVSNYG